MNPQMGFFCLTASLQNHSQILPTLDPGLTRLFPTQILTPQKRSAEKEWPLKPWWAPSGQMTPLPPPSEKRGPPRSWPSSWSNPGAPALWAASPGSPIQGSKPGRSLRRVQRPRGGGGPNLGPALGFFPLLPFFAAICLSLACASCLFLVLSCGFCFWLYLWLTLCVRFSSLWWSLACFPLCVCSLGFPRLSLGLPGALGLSVLVAL